MHTYIKMGQPPRIAPPKNYDIPDTTGRLYIPDRRPFNFPDPRDPPRNSQVVVSRRSPRKSPAIKVGGSRKRNYRKSRKLRKSKVRVRVSKSRRHRRSRRGRRH